MSATDHALQALVVVLLALFAIDASAETVREPILAGSWYPADATELRQTIEGFLNKAESPTLRGEVVALVSPHAGYQYSGPVAAHAFKAIRGQQFDTVVVVAPSHRFPFGGVSVYDQGPFATPLGRIALDAPFIEALVKADPDVRCIPEAHAAEHSLEIQLPFLQTVLQGFRLVPLVMGDQSPEACAALAKGLAAAAQTTPDKRVLFVASTDLSHYHSAAQAKQLDQLVLDSISAFAPDKLAACLAEQRCEACGGGPVIATMLAARALGANTAQVLAYADSGDQSGDKDNVVGYVAAAISKNPETPPPPEPKAQPEAASKHDSPDPGELKTGLSPEDKQSLLRLARETVARALEGKKPPAIAKPSSAMEQSLGAFVTITRQGQLRGCIGNMVGRGPLRETIARMALAAAFEDPRFPPVQPDELPELAFEISVLSPLQTIDDPRKVQVGQHGLLIRSGFRSGVLLPQVPVEQGWDREAFLAGTCGKAGLPQDCWKNPSTEIQVFTADVF